MEDRVNETHANQMYFYLENITNSRQLLYNYSNNTTESYPAILASPNLYMMFFIAVAIFGFFANIYIITVIVIYKPMQKQMANIYIANQSILDASASAMLFFMTLFQNNGSYYKKGNFADEALCRLWYTQMPMWGLLDSSTYNIVALTFERYIAIVHPIWHKTTFSNNKLIVGLSIAFIWFIGTAFNAAYMIPSSGIDNTGMCIIYTFYPSTAAHSVLGVFDFCFEFALPIILIFYGYGSIGWSLRKRIQMTGEAPRYYPVNKRGCRIRNITVDHDVVADGAGSTATGKRESVGTAAPDANQNVTMTKAMRNVLRTSVIIAFFFVFSWSWDEIYYLALNVGNPCCSVTSNFFQLTNALVCLNCCVNPVVYSLTYTEFKKGAAAVFGRKKTIPAAGGLDIGTSSSQRS